jgi:hypothetical protein
MRTGDCTFHCALEYPETDGLGDSSQPLACPVNIAWSIRVSSCRVLRRLVWLRPFLPPTTSREENNLPIYLCVS